jgi:hypothetical protein
VNSANPVGFAAEHPLAQSGIMGGHASMHATRLVHAGSLVQSQYAIWH